MSATPKDFRCKYCSYETEYRSNLARHTKIHHKPDTIKWFECDVEGCDHRTKAPYLLRQHKATKHDVDVVWHACGVGECSFKSKSKAEIPQHRAYRHDINAKTFKCDIEGCDFSCKRKQGVVKHRRRRHLIGTVWHPCKLCSYRCKESHSMKSHLAYRHNIGVTWHKCDFERCTFQTKQISSLQNHKAFRHDLGDKECGFCSAKVFKVKIYEDKHGKHHICIRCWNKVTGKTSRFEEQMSDFLDEHYGTEFLIASDTRVLGDVCTRYRPDKLYADPERVIQVECDEHQHIRYGHYKKYSCEEKRISDIYDEFPGKDYIVVRWNPNRYILPEGKKKVQSFKAKLDLLLKCLKTLEEREFDTKITIIYLLYSDDNPLITQSMKKYMIYQEEDLDELGSVRT